MAYLEDVERVFEYFIENLDFGKRKPLYESDIKNTLNCGKEEIREALILAEKKHGLIIKHGRYIDSAKGISLTSFGKDVKDNGGWTKCLQKKNLDKEKFNLNINNDFRKSTIGQMNQSDFLKVDKTEIKQTIHPKAKEKQQNAIISFVEKFWWQILIPLVIGVILILIEKGIIDIL